MLSSFRQDVMQAIIEEGARPGHNISYGQLADAIGRPEMLGHHLAFPLGDVSRHCHRMGLPLLSAIVVGEHSEEPGEGFWAMVNGLYKVMPYDRQGFLANMQDSVYSYWEDR